MKNKRKFEVAEKAAPPTMERPEPVKKNTGQVPVHSPTGPVQMTPIIQPIAFVPYSTQEQPLYMYDNEQSSGQAGYYDNEYAADPAAYGDDFDQPVAIGKKKISATAIILSILSILMIAVFVIGKFIDLTFVQVANNTSGLDMLLNVFAAEEIVFDIATVVALGIALAVACSVIILVSSLVRIKLKGACVFAKIFGFIGLVAALVAVLISMVQKEIIEINYGMYIIAGLSLLIVLFAFLARNEK